MTAIKWIGVQSIIITISIPISIIVGSLISELFFLFIFTFFPLVGLSQYWAINHLDWAEEWLKYSAIGFFIGSAIAIIQIFTLIDNFHLITNHLISLFIIGLSTACFQARILNREIKDYSFVWELGNFAILLIFVGIAGYINNNYYSLRFDLLVVAISNYKNIVPWTISGALFAIIYTSLTWLFLPDKIKDN